MFFILCTWFGKSSPTDYIGAAALCISGAFVAIKYWQTKRVERATEGNRILSELETNESLRLACQFLDWTARNFKLPDSINSRRVPPTAVKESKDFDELEDIQSGLFRHSSGKMAKALTTQNLYRTDEVLYRDIFDAYVTWLERVNAALDSKIYRECDIQPLTYYVNSLFSPKHHGPETAKAMNEFMTNFYDINRLRLLQERLNGH